MCELCVFKWQVLDEYLNVHEENLQGLVVIYLCLLILEWLGKAVYEFDCASRTKRLQFIRIVASPNEILCNWFAQTDDVAAELYTLVNLIVVECFDFKVSLELA